MSKGCTDHDKTRFSQQRLQGAQNSAQIVEEAIAVDIITVQDSLKEKGNETTLCERFAMVAALYQRNSAPYQKAAVWLALYPTEAFFAVGLTSTDIDDYFYLKSILEVQCTRWAIERIDKDSWAHELC